MFFFLPEASAVERKKSQREFSCKTVEVEESGFFIRTRFFPFHELKVSFFTASHLQATGK